MDERRKKVAIVVFRSLSVQFWFFLLGGIWERDSILLPESWNPCSRAPGQSHGDSEGKLWEVPFPAPARDLSPGSGVLGVSRGGRDESEASGAKGA